MRLTPTQELLYRQVENVLKGMKYGEVKKIKPDHPSYKDFLACCEFIRHHEWDVFDNYYLIISPDEIRKENLIAYQYINKLETALNEKKFLK